VQQQPARKKKKKLLSILMTKMGLYKWAFKILGLAQFWEPQAIA
jgi:hypothetical protein